MAKRQRCGCLSTSGSPAEEFPLKYQAVASVANKRPVEGWRWVVASCPYYTSKWHIRPERIVEIPVVLTNVEIELILKRMQGRSSPETDNLIKKLEAVNDSAS